MAPIIILYDCVRTLAYIYQVRTYSYVTQPGSLCLSREFTIQICKNCAWIVDSRSRYTISVCIVTTVYGNHANHTEYILEGWVGLGALR